MGTYYKECFLEDIYHFDALDVWDKLVPGASVKLSLDMGGDDKRGDYMRGDYTKNVKVELDKEGHENKLLGVLSEEDSKSMLPFIKSGWNDLFSGKICFIDKENEKLRIKVVVYINLKSENQG